MEKNSTAEKLNQNTLKKKRTKFRDAKQKSPKSMPACLPACAPSPCPQGYRSRPEGLLPPPGATTAAVAGATAPAAATVAVLPALAEDFLRAAAFDVLATAGVAEPADDAPAVTTAAAAAAVAVVMASSRSNDRTKALRREKYSLTWVEKRKERTRKKKTPRIDERERRG